MIEFIFEIIGIIRDPKSCVETVVKIALFAGVLIAAYLAMKYRLRKCVNEIDALKNLIGFSDSDLYWNRMGVMSTRQILKRIKHLAITFVASVILIISEALICWLIWCFVTIELYLFSCLLLPVACFHSVLIVVYIRKLLKILTTIKSRKVVSFIGFPVVMQEEFEIIGLPTGILIPEIVVRNPLNGRTMSQGMGIPIQQTRSACDYIVGKSLRIYSDEGEEIILSIEILHDLLDGNMRQAQNL